jgi:hypothetical protein
VSPATTASCPRCALFAPAQCAGVFGVALRWTVNDGAKSWSMATDGPPSYAVFSQSTPRWIIMCRSRGAAPPLRNGVAPSLVRSAVTLL